MCPDEDCNRELWQLSSASHVGEQEQMYRIIIVQAGRLACLPAAPDGLSFQRIIFHIITSYAQLFEHYKQNCERGDI